MSVAKTTYRGRNNIANSKLIKPYLTFILSVLDGKGVRVVTGIENSDPRGGIVSLYYDLGIHRVVTSVPFLSCSLRETLWYLLYIAAARNKNIRLSRMSVKKYVCV